MTTLEGLVLVTGPTGAGKTSSLASMIQNINASQPVHILTLEDPIEFIFPRGKGVVRQRQKEDDFADFNSALRRVLRQDPDIVFIGEMRDRETISAALTLAETGHLIFGTLHTPNAIQTVDRIVDSFPASEQAQVRSQLSVSLKAVMSQRLLPSTDGGRVALREVLINTPAVANIVRESRNQELLTVLQSGSDFGMFSMNQHLEFFIRKWRTLVKKRSSGLRKHCSVFLLTIDTV